jgi:iron complex transport system substrate-binding protein
MKKADYEKLSALAPTIAPPKGEGDYFSPWDIQTQMIADALGQHEEGEQLIAQVKDTFAKAAAEHPEFAGKTATFAQNGFYSGLLYVYPEGVNTEFLTYLGFRMNPKVNKLPHKASEQASVSQEQLPVIDADTIVFATEEPKDVDNFEKVPTFMALDAVKENRAVYTDGTLAGAIYFDTPLSRAYVLEKLTPMLEQVPTFMALDAVQGNRAVFTDGTLAGAIYFMTPLSLQYVVEHLTPQLADAVAGQAPRRIVQ